MNIEQNLLKTETPKTAEQVQETTLSEISTPEKERAKTEEENRKEEEEKQKIEKTREEINKHFEVFNAPAELEKIKKMILPEKEKAINQFKEKLKHQLKGIAIVQQSMVDAIQKNPDMTDDGFISSLESKSTEYGFSNEIIDRAKLYFHNYQERHRELNEFKQKNTTDNELFKGLFGEYPDGKIKIFSGPISLEITCSNLKDFSWIYDHVQNKGVKSPKEVSVFKALGTGFDLGGFALNKEHVSKNAPVVQVINKNMPFSQKEIKHHEGQHVWYDAVFLQQEENTKHWHEMFIKKYEQKKLISYVKSENLSEIKLLELEKNFKEYSQELLEYSCESVKDEILAHIKGGTAFLNISFTLNSIFTKLLYGSYDYLKEIRNPSKDDPLNFWKNLESKDEEKNILSKQVDNMQELKKHDILISEVVRRVKKQAEDILDIYKKRTTDAIKAISKIKSKSFSRDQIIALLTEVSLQDFPKIAERV